MSREVEGMSEDPERVAARAIRWFAYGCVPMCVISLGVVAIPKLFVSGHGPSHDTLARRALRTIIGAESIFREGDKDKNGLQDYGTLAQLSQARLVEEVLGSGTRSGYLFRVAPSSSTSEFLWFATATPVVPTTTGDRYFCTNQAGLIFYTTAGAFALNTTDCQIPSNAQPVGK